MSLTQCHYPMVVVGPAHVAMSDFRGVERFGFKMAQHQRATDFFLLRADGTGVRYSVIMTDIAERLEVGVIHVELISTGYGPEQTFLLPSGRVTTFSTQRLVLRTDYGSVDSGLVLTGHDGSEIVIVSGAYPFTVEVRMSLNLPEINRFDPEYSLDSYSREPLIPD